MKLPARGNLYLVLQDMIYEETNFFIVYSVLTESDAWNGLLLAVT